MVLIKEHIHQRGQIESGLLFRSLVRWATLRPEAPFLVEAETGRALSYQQTLAGVAALRLVLGEAPCHIILALPGGITTALIWLSALSGGHHLLPVAPNATEGEKSTFGEKHQPDVIIVEHAEDAAAFGQAGARVFTRKACEAYSEQAGLQILPEAREGYAYLTTSGSTGEPKGVVLTERQIAWTAEQVRQSHELSSLDRGLTVLPFFHVNAPVVSLCASLLAGSTVVMAGRFSRQQFWSWVENYHITWVSLVPTIVAILLETEKPAFLPGALRFVRTGSAALPPANMYAFEARFGIPVIETYGLSEAASQIVANPLPPGQHKAGSAGRPTGVTLRICMPRLGEEMQSLCDVPDGETGEICIAGPAVIKSYQSNEGREAFQDGWFRTGDLGYLDSDGYLFLKGRMREVINRGGENIAPREIEELLQRYPLVREAAVVGRPDPIYGEQVVAYLAVRESWSATDLAELRQYAAQHLSTPKVPVDLIILDELPRNASGKLDRRLLRERERVHCLTIR